MDKELLWEKKIAVVSIGGVGGYIAGMLARDYPNITVVVRGKHGESIREKVIHLHSEHNGGIVVHPENVVSSSLELEPQDYIFICVKNYSLEEVCDELKYAIKDKTVILPVMNSIDVGERVRKQVGRGTVIDSLIYIVAFANSDDSVTQQGDFASLRVGASKEEDINIVQDAACVLDKAGIEYKISRNIISDIWKKYILNCAYNVATAYYDNTIDELRSNPKKAEEYEQLVYEAYQVEVAKGVQIEKEHADSIVRRFHEIWRIM